MRRWIAAVLIVATLGAAAPSPVAAAGLIPIPGGEEAQWEVLVQVLKTILTLRLDQGGANPGLKVLMGEIYRFLDRGFPNPLRFNLLARFKQTFDGLQRLRNEVQQ